MAAHPSRSHAGPAGDWPRWAFDLTQGAFLVPLSQMASAKRLEVDPNGSWKGIQIRYDSVASSLQAGTAQPGSGTICVFPLFPEMLKLHPCDPAVRTQPTHLQELPISAWKRTPLPSAQRGVSGHGAAWVFSGDCQLQGPGLLKLISRLQRECEDRLRLV